MAHGGKREGAGRKPKTGQLDDIARFNEARADKERALADIRTAEAQKLRGELLESAVVGEEWTRLTDLARARLLALPSRVAPLVVHLNEIREVENLLLEYIHEALRALANDSHAGTTL